MFRKNITVTVIIFVSLNLCALVLAQEQRGADELESARARRTKQLSNSLRGNRIFTFHSGFGFIGDLPYWKSILPLADNQAVALKDLDSLLYKANTASLDNDADYLDTNPRDYKEYPDRSKRRRKAAVKHGQLMSFTGLLTKFQSNAVVQQHQQSHAADNQVDDHFEFCCGLLLFRLPSASTTSRGSNNSPALRAR